VLKALPDYLGPVATVLAVVLAYYFGRRQTEYQRLYERRAKVIAGLFERYARMDQQYQSLRESLLMDLWDRPVDLSGRPEKENKENRTLVELASESFEELLQYHRANSIWLSRSTSRRLSDFTERYSKRFRALQLAHRPIKPGERWRENLEKSLGSMAEFNRESLEIRNALEDEFQAALGDRRAKLARLWRIRLDVRPRSRWEAHRRTQRSRALWPRSRREEAQEPSERVPWWRRWLGG
jgi:hypothetical protein